MKNWLSFWNHSMSYSRVPTPIPGNKCACVCAGGWESRNVGSKMPDSLIFSVLLVSIFEELISSRRLIIKNWNPFCIPGPKSHMTPSEAMIQNLSPFLHKPMLLLLAFVKLVIVDFPLENMNCLPFIYPHPWLLSANRFSRFIVTFGLINKVDRSIAFLPWKMFNCLACWFACFSVSQVNLKLCQLSKSPHTFWFLGLSTNTIFFKGFFEALSGKQAGAGHGYSADSQLGRTDCQNNGSTARTYKQIRGPESKLWQASWAASQGEANAQQR